MWPVMCNHWGYQLQAWYQTLLNLMEKKNDNHVNINCFEKKKKMHMPWCTNQFTRTHVLSWIWALATFYTKSCPIKLSYRQTKSWNLMNFKPPYPSYAAFALLKESFLCSTQEIWSSCYSQDNSLSHFVFTHTNFYCSFKVPSQQGLTQKPISIWSPQIQQSSQNHISRWI